MQIAASRKKTNEAQNSALIGATCASQPAARLEMISPIEYAESTVVITTAIRSRGMPIER